MASYNNINKAGTADSSNSAATGKAMSRTCCTPHSSRANSGGINKPGMDQTLFFPTQHS
jgi:hypothetical protein